MIQAEGGPKWGLCQVHPKNEGGFGGTGKWRALEGRWCQDLTRAQAATDQAQRTDFTVEVRNGLGFLKGYGHSGGRRTEMRSPGLR